VISIPVYAVFAAFVFAWSTGTNMPGSYTKNPVSMLALLAGYLILILVILVIALLYYAGFESSKRMGTPGKMAMGLIVVGYDGKRISFLRALLRYIGKVVSSMILCIGYLMIGFTEKKQGLHDMIAKTYVIIKQSAPSQSSAVLNVVQ
jgi:uncharacterized RDD family membrane protein YckC